MGLGRTRTYAICRMLEELWAKIITKWVSQGVKLPRDAEADGSPINPEWIEEGKANYNQDQSVLI